MEAVLQLQKCREEPGNHRSQVASGKGKQVNSCKDISDSLK